MTACSTPLRPQAHAQRPRSALRSNYGRAGSVRAVPDAAVLDRDRLRGLIERERAALRDDPHELARALRAGGPQPARRRAHELDGEVGGRPPRVRRARARGAEIVDVDGHHYVDFCLGDTGAMAGHAPPADRGARSSAQAQRGNTLMLPTEDAVVGRRGAAAALRAGALAVHAVGDRREPRRHPARAPGHRPAEDPGLQLLLPRHRRRDLHHAARRTAAPGRATGNVGPPVDPRGDDQGRRVQRPRGARGRARARRRRLRAGRAGADQHRDRPARARLPRRAARSDAGRRARCW